MKKWKINLLHMSHTDIGYTDTQARILESQVNNLHDLVANYKKHPEKFKKWHWICESFYIVEMFMNDASKEEKASFNKMIKEGIVSLSASFLNISELANTNLYDKILDRSFALAEKNGWKMDSVICNDINGFSYGYASAMAKHNIKNLYLGLHTHHGMFPAFKKQHPFYWQTKDGSKILVWVGEHYQGGNELGFLGGAMGNYILQSDLPSGDGVSEDEQIKIAVDRVKLYLANMEKSGYPFTNIPLSVLGAATDNAPYNLSILDRVKKMTKPLKDIGVEVEMTTLEEFFENITKENKEIPTYVGDWPDWWTDGTGSSPKAVRVFRQAQRNYELISKLGIKHKDISDLELNLMMFAEHTFGAWSSMEDPFTFWNTEIDAIKSGYAATAQNLASKILDQGIKRKDYQHQHVDENPVVVKILNPFPSKITKMIKVEWFTGKEWGKYMNGIEVKQDGKVVESYVMMQYYMKIPQPQLYCLVDMSKGKEITLEIRPKKSTAVAMTSPTSMMGADRITDTYNPLNNDQVFVRNKSFENDKIILRWNENGIYSLFSKVTNKELLNDKQEGLFSPVYEVCEIPYEFELMNLHRRYTGRNRKARNTRRHYGKIVETRVTYETKESTQLEFYFDVVGTKQYKLILEIPTGTDQIIAKIKMVKDVEWSLENFYMSLPFNKEENRIKFDKGEMFEIWKEQIPGTLIDYYAIQNGIKIETPVQDVLISAKDNHLFWTGSLDFEKRFLAHDSRNNYQPNLYAWLLNTSWETNFQANIGGFHEFNYTIYLPSSRVTDTETLNELKVLNDTFAIKRDVK